jgi:hypothetical protein
MASPSMESLKKNQLTLALEIDKALSEVEGRSDLPPLKPFHHRSTTTTTPPNCPPHSMVSQTDTIFLRRKLSQSNITLAAGPGAVDYETGSRGTFKSESVLDNGIEEECHDTLLQMNDTLSQLQIWKQEQLAKEAELKAIMEEHTGNEKRDDDSDDDSFLSTTEGFASFEDAVVSDQSHGLEIADKCVLDLMQRRRAYCEERAMERQKLEKAKAAHVESSSLDSGFLKLQSEVLKLKLKEFGLTTEHSELPSSRFVSNAAKNLCMGTSDMSDYNLEEESWDDIVTEEEKVHIHTRSWSFTSHLNPYPQPLCVGMR